MKVTLLTLYMKKLEMVDITYFGFDNVSGDVVYLSFEAGINEIVKDMVNNKLFTTYL